MNGKDIKKNQKNVQNVNQENGKKEVKMDNLQGTVELISKKNNAVQINGVWYTLGPLVKMTYVKKGACEYRAEKNPDPQGNPLVVFVKSLVTAQGTIQNPAGKPPAVAESEMNRMSALKFAGNVYMGTGQEDDAKRLAEEAHEYLQKGLWITTEKAGIGKPVQAPTSVPVESVTTQPQQQYDDAY